MSSGIENSRVQRSYSVVFLPYVMLVLVARHVGCDQVLEFPVDLKAEKTLSFGIKPNLSLGASV